MSKINKLGKSTFVIAILSFLLVAVLAFGGTYAYFTASKSINQTSVETGKLAITLTEDKVGDAAVVKASGKVVPNQQIIKETVTVSDENTNIKYYIRATYEISVAGETNNEECMENLHGILHNDVKSILEIDNDENKDWMAYNGKLYYIGTAAGEGATVENTNAKVMTPGTDTDAAFVLDVFVKEHVGAGECDFFQGRAITINLKIETIQATYLKDGDHTTQDFATPSVKAVADRWDAILTAEKTAPQAPQD
ncbi:MAG: SipW-dependent-type signal peptide-containing protein [Clostridia bacterium]